MSETNTTPPIGPESAKLLAAREKSEIIGEFLDDLPRLGLVLCRQLEPTFENGMQFWIPNFESINAVLARYFGIDLDALEREQRVLLERIATEAHITTGSTGEEVGE